MNIPNTSLAAIVRNERVNAAGGIHRFMKGIVPHVEEAVIIDTGSTDGTRELLEEAQSKYSNLRVYDIPFKGFDNARNYSLKKVRTSHVLILDADELLKPDQLAIVAQRLAGEPKQTHWTFTFTNNGEPQGVFFSDWSTFRTRLFRKDARIQFRRPVYEDPLPGLFSSIRTERTLFGGKYIEPYNIGAVIDHYCNRKHLNAKSAWYTGICEAHELLPIQDRPLYKQPTYIRVAAALGFLQHLPGCMRPRLPEPPSKEEFYSKNKKF